MAVLSWWDMVAYFARGDRATAESNLYCQLQCRCYSHDELFMLIQYALSSCVTRALKAAEAFSLGHMDGKLDMFIPSPYGLQDVILGKRFGLAAVNVTGLFRRHTLGECH